MLVLSQMGRSLESLPSDLAAAVKEGRIPAKIVMRYVELEKPPEFRWLLQFGGFRERLLADHLFLAKLGMECGVGIFTKNSGKCKGMYTAMLPIREDWERVQKTAAEYERQREKFFNELEIVFADVTVLDVIGHGHYCRFMLVYLLAPTVSLQPSPAIEAGPIAKFFHRCPDNAFQVALGGASYSLVQRSGAIVVSLCR
ncbi:RETICULATA-RELATED 4, chloroplastic-like protein [Drosera capensis]